MITDADIQKMKKVFATKDDLKPLATGLSHLDKKVGTLDKKVDSLDKKVGTLDKKVGTLDKKVDSLDKKINTIETKLDDLTEYVVPALGSIFKWTDDIHSAFVGSKRHPKIVSEN